MDVGGEPRSGKQRLCFHWKQGNEQTYPKLQAVTTQQNTSIPYNLPAFLTVNNGYTYFKCFCHEYITKGHMAMHAILF